MMKIECERNATNLCGSTRQQMKKRKRTRKSNVCKQDFPFLFIFRSLPFPQSPSISHMKMSLAIVESTGLTHSYLFSARENPFYFFMKKNYQFCFHSLLSFLVLLLLFYLVFVEADYCLKFVRFGNAKMLKPLFYCKI